VKQGDPGGHVDHAGRGHPVLALKAPHGRARDRPEDAVGDDMHLALELAHGVAGGPELHELDGVARPQRVQAGGGGSVPGATTALGAREAGDDWSGGHRRADGQRGSPAAGRMPAVQSGDLPPVAGAPERDLPQLGRG